MTSEPENSGDHSGLLITRLRRQVDRLDDRLLALLRQRVAVARELGHIKRSSGLPLRDSGRENALLQRLTSSGSVELAPEDVEQVFRCIIAVSLACEERDEQV